MSPKHVYRARHDPPTIGDHLMIHSALIVICALSVLLSVSLFVGTITNPLGAFVAQDNLPVIVPILTALTLGIGGIAAARGLVWLDAQDASAEWVLEKVGWTLQSTGFTAIAVSLAGQYQLASIGLWAAFAALALVAALRVWIVGRIEDDGRAMQAKLDKSRRGEA